MELTPFLNQDRRTGVTVLHAAAIVRGKELTLVDPNDTRSVVSGYRISGGKISQFEVPKSLASAQLLEALNLASTSPSCL